jgi:hypothetical protein
MSDHENEIDRHVRKSGAQLGDGVVRMYSGELVNVLYPKSSTLHMYDIAWHLGRIIRYNGGIKQDYTVAHHSLIMSYFVPEQYALEALLHDAGEAYLGDIIHPIKVLYPAISMDESYLTGKIMDKFGRGDCDHCLLREVGRITDSNTPYYEKSDVVTEADGLLYAHECYSFADRPGVFNAKMQNAWMLAIDASENLWHAPMYPFMYRYHELIGNLQTVGTPYGALTHADINAALDALWYKTEAPEFPELEEHQEEQIALALEEF